MCALPVHMTAPRFCADCGGALNAEKDASGGWACQRCSVHTFVDPKVASCAVPWLDGKVLLVRRAIEPRIGFFSSPGGYCERGEPPARAAERECFEETGLVVQAKELLGVFAHKGSPVIVIYYDCEVLGGGEPRAVSEVSEVGLFRPDEIPWEKLAFSSVNEALCAAIARRYAKESVA